MAAHVDGGPHNLQEDGNSRQPQAVLTGDIARFEEERRMHGLIYIIGLIVVIMAILSLIGLR